MGVGSSPLDNNATVDDLPLSGIDAVCLAALPAVSFPQISFWPGILPRIML